MQATEMLDPFYKHRLTERLLSPDLNLGIFPSRYLDDKVYNPLVALVWVQWNIMPEGNGLSVLFEPYTPVLDHQPRFEVGF